VDSWWIHGEPRHPGGILRRYNVIYPLVMTNGLTWYRWPIEIDGLPFLQMGGFSIAMFDVNICLKWVGCPQIHVSNPLVNPLVFDVNFPTQ
jgi:hypothetical protein